MRLFIGLLMLVAGVGIILKTEWIIQNFGTNAWAEAKLGTEGGSRLLYKGIGLVLIFVGFMLMFGLFQGFLEGTVGRIFVR